MRTKMSDLEFGKLVKIENCTRVRCWALRCLRPTECTAHSAHTTMPSGVWATRVVHRGRTHFHGRLAMSLLDDCFVCLYFVFENIISRWWQSWDHIASDDYSHTNGNLRQCLFRCACVCVCVEDAIDVTFHGTLVNGKGQVCNWYLQIGIKFMQIKR